MRTLLSGICVLALAGTAAAHPGNGGGGGPPPTVTMGPPAGAMSHVPNGVANGFNANSGLAQAANLLGNLNAAHASANGLAHASPNSIVGKLSIYKSQMTTALSNEQAAQAAVDADNAVIN